MAAYSLERWSSFFSDGKMTENTFSSGISVNGSSVFQSCYWSTIMCSLLCLRDLTLANFSSRYSRWRAEMLPSSSVRAVFKRLKVRNYTAHIIQTTTLCLLLPLEWKREGNLGTGSGLILELTRLRQEDCGFEVSLDYTVRLLPKPETAHKYSRDHRGTLF